ncbi:MAG TPA: type II secretion system protein GspM [Rhodopseudomonas sp.]|uniref:type II secretion system protein GspM n=1 Tax=Rhodopseudomonas sp. TaxID=1078 RepID=UPI002ED96CDE
MKLSLRDRRVAAPAIFGCLLAAAILVAGLQQAALDAAVLERDAKTELIERLRRTDPARAGGGAARQAPRQDPYVASETATLAAAEIDRLVRTVVTKVNGAVLSTQVTVERGDDAAMRRIEVHAVIEGPIEAIQHTLFDLETGAPLMFVSDLELQPAERAGAKQDANQPPRLQGTMALNAYWRSGP